MRKSIVFLFLTTQSLFMGQSCTMRSNIFPLHAETGATNNGGTVQKEKEPASRQTPGYHSCNVFDFDPRSADRRRECLEQYYSVCPPMRRLSVSSRFGPRRNPFTKEGTVMHHGLDLRTVVNTEVFSMFHGRVIAVGYNERSGNFVTMRHGDYTISFCHLSRPLVRKGDFLRAGDVLGLSGNSGRSTGPHLHLTVRRNGDYVNPAILLLYILDIRTQAIEELSGHRG